jgi:hypothetical protein
MGILALGLGMTGIVHIAKGVDIPNTFPTFSQAVCDVKSHCLNALIKCFLSSVYHAQQNFRTGRTSQPHLIFSASQASSGYPVSTPNKDISISSSEYLLLREGGTT